LIICFRLVSFVAKCSIMLIKKDGTKFVYKEVSHLKEGDKFNSNIKFEDNNFVDEFIVMKNMEIGWNIIEFNALSACGKLVIKMFVQI
jgi:hypothetical protein